MTTRGVAFAVAFVAGIVLAVAGLRAATSQPAGTGIELDTASRAGLDQALAPWHRQYDAAAHMLRRPFSSPGYHTTLQGGDVHPTRDSLGYALACLDRGDDALRERAVAVLRRVVALQDPDPASKTYGIWSWFLEEPLDRMSPPDWNWADFCGALLLQVVRDHGRRLPEDLRMEVDRALAHASASIQRRNVGPDYTNIALMGTYVTLVTAERYDLPGLLDYARARLRRVHDHICRQGAFTEYNSPTYTVVALKELARMRTDFSRAEDRALVEPLYRMAWEEIATHFHAPTRQWAGPHSRCYRTFLGDEVLGLIQRATEQRVDFGVRAASLDSHRTRVPCPAEFEGRFREPRTEARVQTFVPGEHPVVGTTWMTPEFVLASVNRGELWNQRRPLLAYWGTATRPASLRVRFLRDGGDFAAAQFASVQRRGRVLAALALATDGGQTHVSLDRMKEATFEAADLRLRFEFGGAAADGELPVRVNPAEPVFRLGGSVPVWISVPFAVLGSQPSRWEVRREGETVNLDLVLFEAPRTAIRLADLAVAGVGLAVQVGEDRAPVVQARLEPPGDRLALAWEELALSLAVKPAKATVLRNGARFGSGGGAP